MSNGIFYTAVDGNVQGKINGRGRIYAATERKSDDFKWLAARTVYASAYITTQGKQTVAALTIPQGGGFGGSGLYSSSGTDKTGDKRLLPKSHITSIKLSSIGDWGSVKTCELSFTCYSLEQLNSRLAFLELGAELTVHYGWGGGSTVASGGTFEGKIWNFNYSVNNTGGWDCTVKAMGKGIDAVSGNIKGGKSGESATDPTGLTVPSFDILSRINILVMQAKDLAHNEIKKDSTYGVNLGCLEYATSWGAATASPEGEATAVAADAEAPTDEKHYYVTLQSIVNQIQQILLTPAKQDTKLICDDTVTLSPAPSNADYLISANPREVIFPGYNSYGAKHDFNFEKGMFGTPMKSAQIMISVEWLGSILANLGETADGQKAADFSIAKFLGLIFDSIYTNSGRRISLSLSNNPEKPDGKEWWVVDTNYKNGSITPFKINAFNTNSVVRNIQISSAVSDTMANAAFVSAGSPAGDATSQVYGTKVVKKTAAEKDAELYNSFKQLKELFDATEPPKKPAKGEQLNAGPTDANVSSMQSILASIYTQSPDGGPHRNVPYPLNLSVTIDGIEGIIFGNVITTNYLPGIFFDLEGSKVVFTVTQVDHDISISDWTTTINTVCRMPL